MWKTAQWVLQSGLQIAHITPNHISLNKTQVLKKKKKQTQVLGPKPNARNNGQGSFSVCPGKGNGTY